MRSGVPLDFAPVDDLVKALREVDGIRSVDVDPGEVNVPGIWVQVVGFDPDLLAANTLKLRLLLIVADGTRPRDVMDELRDLYNATLAVLQPDGPVTARTVALPDGGLYPALAFSLDLYPFTD